MSTICMRHSSSVNANSVKSEWLSTWYLQATRIQDEVDRTIGNRKQQWASVG